MRKPRQEKRRASIGALAGRALCACALAATMAPAAALAVEGADGASASLGAGAIAVQDEAAIYAGNVSASLSSATQVTVKGYDGYSQGRRPNVKTFDAMANPKVTITCGDLKYADSAEIGGGGAVAISGNIVVGTYTVVISSDNYADKTVSFSYPAASSATIGGANYEYLDATKALEYVDAEAKASALTAYTRIGETDIYYKVAEGSTALSGTVYGMDMTSATSYSTLYNSLIEGGSFSADDYDTITSATGIVSNHHYGQLSSLVARDLKYDETFIADAATTEEQKLENKLTGAYCTPTTVEAEPYVEAYILDAAGQELSDDQKALMNVRLNGNATVDPSTVTNRVAVDEVTTSDFFTGWSYFDPTTLGGNKAYGQVKFVIRPTAGANTNGGTAFSWTDYYQSLYAGTISDGTVTVGMAPWIDLYAEADHKAVEMSINNGTNPYNQSNKATVNRFASMYDPATGSLKAGDYTITLYAAGYNPLSYTFKLGAVVPSDDLKSLTIENAEVTDGATATVTAYSLNEDEGNIGKAGDVYAQNVAVIDGKIALDKMLVAGDYKVVVNDCTYTFKVSQETVDAVTLQSLENGTYALSAKAITESTYGTNSPREFALTRQFDPNIMLEKSDGGMSLSLLYTSTVDMQKIALDGEDADKIPYSYNSDGSVAAYKFVVSVSADADHHKLSFSYVAGPMGLMTHSVYLTAFSTSEWSGYSYKAPQFEKPCNIKKTMRRPAACRAITRWHQATLRMLCR